MALKLGTENKNKTYAAIGLMIIALIYGIYVVYDQFFSSPAPAVVATTPPPTSPVRSAATVYSHATSGSVGQVTSTSPFAHQAVELQNSSSLDPTLRPELMAQAEDTTYTGTGRNIFSADSSPMQTARNIPKPNNSIRPGPGSPPAFAGPPPPPNIELKFYGYSAVKNGGRKAFLLHGEDIFIAQEGDTVDRRYKVVKISPFSIDVEDLPYSHTQTLPLIQN